MGPHRDYLRCQLTIEARCRYAAIFAGAGEDWPGRPIGQANPEGFPDDKRQLSFSPFHKSPGLVGCMAKALCISCINRYCFKRFWLTRPAHMGQPHFFGPVRE